MYQMRPTMGVESGPPHTAFRMRTTFTWLYLRVVKLDPNLLSRLRERLITFEHSLSVVQVYTRRNKQRERVRPVGVSTQSCQVRKVASLLTEALNELIAH